MSLIAVIGGVHHQIASAAEGLVRIENELGRPIARVFTTKDLIRRHIINPGWPTLFECDGGTLAFLQTWPETKNP